MTGFNSMTFLTTASRPNQLSHTACLHSIAILLDLYLHWVQIWGCLEAAMASETTERAVRYNIPGYQGNQVSMVYLYSDQEKIGGIHDFDYRNVVTERYCTLKRRKQWGRCQWHRCRCSDGKRIESEITTKVKWPWPLIWTFHGNIIDPLYLSQEKRTRPYPTCLLLTRLLLEGLDAISDAQSHRFHEAKKFSEGVTLANTYYYSHSSSTWATPALFALRAFH